MATIFISENITLSHNPFDKSVNPINPGPEQNSYKVLTFSLTTSQYKLAKATPPGNL